MSTRRKRSDKVLELLKREYLGAGHETETGSLWQERVMSHIHERAVSPSAGLMTLMGQLSWRFLPATASLAVILAVLVVRGHLAIDYNPLRFMINHAESLMLTRLLGS
jgi:hypothetical protein